MELKTIGLTKKFGSKTAVNALNITLTNGVYGLLGANGAGKTTLMRLLCNIQTPTSGKILLNGRNIVELGEKYRNLLGYLPQHFGYYHIDKQIRQNQMRYCKGSSRYSYRHSHYRAGCGF